MTDQLRPGNHESRGKHEADAPWCLFHNRPSPYSNTYCDIDFAKYSWRPESACRVRSSSPRFPVAVSDD